jgi:hypothetical protein
MNRREGKGILGLATPGLQHSRRWDRYRLDARRSGRRLSAGGYFVMQSAKALMT